MSLQTSPSSPSYRARARGAPSAAPATRGAGYPPGRSFEADGPSPRPVSMAGRSRGPALSAVSPLSLSADADGPAPTPRGAFRARARASDHEVQLRSNLIDRGALNRRSLPASRGPPGAAFGRGAGPPPVAALPPPSEFPIACEALFECSADTDNELSFNRGDVLSVVAKPHPQWWMARLGSKEGLVPSNYLKVIEPSSSSPSPPPASSPHSPASAFAAQSNPSNASNLPSASPVSPVVRPPSTRGMVGVAPKIGGFVPSSSVGTPQLVMLPVHGRGSVDDLPASSAPRTVGRLSSAALSLNNNNNNNGPQSSPPPASPSSSASTLLLSLYDCQADSADELELQRHDVLQLLEKKFPAWWFGENLRTKRRGIFPSNYVQEILAVVRAVHEFVPQSPDELGFPKGALVFVESELDADWRYGSYAAQKGIFPISWVEPYDPSAPAPPPLPSATTPAKTLSSPPPVAQLPPSSSSHSPVSSPQLPPKKPSNSIFAQFKKPKKEKSSKGKEKDIGFQDITGQDQLIRILTSFDLSLVKAVLSLCDLREKDKMAMCFVHLFELNGTTSHLVMTLIEQEISETTPGSSAAASLFRGNSVATKILTAYSLITGTEYLKKTLKPLISSVVYSSGGWEIDPNRIPANENLKDNIQNLLAVVTMFISKILRSVDAIPILLRRILAHMSNVLRAKFPDAESSVMGSFFFLRFICPSIISPVDTGIWTDKLPPSCLRCLVLISKTLQCLANGVLFGQKEQFMEPLNPFIQDHLPQVKQFYHQIINLNEENVSIAAASGSVLKRDPEVFTFLNEVLASRIDTIRSHMERHDFSNLEKIESLESYLRELHLIS